MKITGKRDPSVRQAPDAERAKREAMGLSPSPPTYAPPPAPPAQPVQTRKVPLPGTPPSRGPSVTWGGEQQRPQQQSQVRTPQTKPVAQAPQKRTQRRPSVGFRRKRSVRKAMTIRFPIETVNGVHGYAEATGQTVNAVIVGATAQCVAAFLAGNS